MNRIEIRFIPEAEMRQPGIGDWWFEGDTLHIRATNDTLGVTEGGDQWPFLVAIHEAVEAFLCREAGVDQQAVDDFDNSFVPPDDDPDAEPGDDPASPYREQHRKAMLIEHLLAIFLGVSDYGMIR